mmetsp:Transcript_6570/g.19186  ORF Transcript_6570/g.19186 Transcript_6570/m.19186 type:complete len:214 (+) Transcript_6570:695-1336(+)
MRLPALAGLGPATRQAWRRRWWWARVVVAREAWSTPSSTRPRRWWLPWRKWCSKRARQVERQQRQLGSRTLPSLRALGWTTRRWSPTRTVRSRCPPFRGGRRPRAEAAALAAHPRGLATAMARRTLARGPRCRVHLRARLGTRVRMMALQQPRAAHPPRAVQVARRARVRVPGPPPPPPPRLAPPLWQLPKGVRAMPRAWLAMVVQAKRTRQH